MLGKSVIKLVKDNYGIDILSSKEIKDNLYSINNYEYLLKIISKKDIDNILKEIKIIEHLSKKDLPVLKYIKTIDKEYYFTYRKKYIFIQKYANVEIKKLNTATNSQMLESAMYLGKLIISLKGLRNIQIRDTKSWFNIKANVLKKEKLSYKVKGKYKSQIIHDLNEKMYLLNYIKDQININEMIKKTTIMNTHGDYNISKLLFKDEKIYAIIDFTKVCKMMVIWEVIRSYIYIDSKCKNGNIDIDDLVLYVKEFTKYVKLNKYDLKYMPYVYLLQLLSSDYGYKQYIDDETKINLLKNGMYRMKIIKELLDKACIISERLLSEVDHKS